MATKSYLTENNLPLLQQDLIGNTNNYYSNKTPVRVFGRNSNVDNARVALWEGPTADYVPPAAGIQLRVVSDNAADAAAGTGVRKVHIHYLDSNYLEQVEEVTLNGVTEVLTVATNAIRVNNTHATSVGSGGAAAGTISITNTAGTVTYDLIGAGHNASRTGFYTVPANKTLYISHWQASSGSSGSHFTQVTLRTTSKDGTRVAGVFTIEDEVGVQNNGSTITFPIPIKVPAMSDVKFTAISDNAAANAVALGAFLGWLE